MEYKELDEKAVEEYLLEMDRERHYEELEEKECKELMVKYQWSYLGDDEDEN